jgi:probable F420-dependent oxidoreductase
VRVGLSLGDLATLVDDARHAEQSGFDDVACGEHAFFHGAVPNAFVALAAAAGATSTVRLVSTISLAPLYPPALFAKLVASLDVVSGGRFEVGVGAGGEYPPEFEACGIDPAGRFRRLEEAVTVCRLLFSGEPVDFDGEFTQLRGVQLNPPPTRRPGPPIWMAGRKGKPLQRVGRLADVWLPYMVSPDMMADGLAQVRSSAAEHGRPPGSVAGAVFAWTCADPDGDWARRTGIDMVSRTYQQDFASLADRYLFMGTPERIVERLGEYAAAGAERVIIAVAAGDADRRRVVETIAERVLPALAKL